MPERMTPNQMVAMNLRLARKIKGWSQEKAGKALRPYLGEAWSKARWSQAEKADNPDTVRGFTADELVAFSLAFDLPVVWFLMPPVEQLGEDVPAEVGNTDPGTPLPEYLDAVWRTDFDLKEPGDFENRLLELRLVLGWRLADKIRSLIQPQAVTGIQALLGEVLSFAGALDEVRTQLNDLLVAPLWAEALRAGGSNHQEKGEEE